MCMISVIEMADLCGYEVVLKFMRIAYFLYEFPLLSETFILNQITGMIDRGHDVDIYANHRSKLDKHHPQIASYNLLSKTRFFFDIPDGFLKRWIKVIGLIRGIWRRPELVFRITTLFGEGRQNLNLRFMYAILAIADRGNYDVIHCQFGTLGPLALTLKRLHATDGKIVTSFRGYDISRAIRNDPSIYNKLFQEGDLFLAVSKNIRDKLLAAGCPSEKIVVLHSGIDCARFRFAEHQKGLLEQVKVLSIGRLVEKKGLEYAIEAVANVHKTGRNLHYSIVGDGELRNDLEKKIADCRIQDLVDLFGWQDHNSVTRILSEAHIFITPSVTADDGDQEGIPNVLKEAMATGLPVLGTLHSGIPELVEDGVTGCLVPERNVEALTDSLIDLYDHPEKWTEMGKKGREKVEAEFDTEKINDDLEQIYTRLC